MARPLRVVVPGAWYHVMARGIERRTIYSDEGSRKLFIHLNPVRVIRFGASRCDDKGPSAEQMVEMVKELTEFKWSSYRSYAGYTPAPKWLCTEAVMNWVPARTEGGKREQYRQRFREMMGAGDLGTSWKESVAGDLVLGGREMGTGPANGYEPAPFLRPGPPKLRPKTVKRFGVKRLLGEKEQRHRATRWI